MSVIDSTVGSQIGMMRSNQYTSLVLNMAGLPPMHSRFLYFCLSGVKVEETIKRKVWVVDRGCDTIETMTTLHRWQQFDIRNSLSEYKIYAEEKRSTIYGSLRTLLIFDSNSILRLSQAVRREIQFKDSPQVTYAASLLLKDHTAWLLLLWMHSMSNYREPIVEIPSFLKFRKAMGITQTTMKKCVNYLIDTGCIKKINETTFGLIHGLVNPLYLPSEIDSASLEMYRNRLPDTYRNIAQELMLDQIKSIKTINEISCRCLSRMSINLQFIQHENIDIPRSPSRNYSAEYEAQTKRLEKMLRVGVMKHIALATSENPFCPVFSMMEEKENNDYSLFCRALAILKSDDGMWNWVKSLYRAGDIRAISVIDRLWERNLITENISDPCKLCFMREEMGTRIMCGMACHQH
jgi:hypothetical protein